MQPVLKIDLTTGETEEYRIPIPWERDFLGGASCCSARIERAAYPLPTTLQHVRVDHGRSDVLVPQEFLHCPNIVSILQQVGSKAMPERMALPRLSRPAWRTACFTAFWSTVSDT